ncbi:Putative ribonuclease H protein At1g65750 [Linum perenne]
MGARSAIRNGLDTQFWTARWIDSGIRLLDVVEDGAAGIDISATVAEFTNDDNQWDVDKLSSVLTADQVSMVVGMSPPNPDSGEDEWVWGMEPNGLFSIKSAYKILLSRPDAHNQKVWHSCWKWKGPNRIRFFLWLAMQEKLLTNVERCRRHITTNDLCEHCRRSPESVTHVLRDCTFAAEVWNLVGSFNCSEIWWQHTTTEWLTGGINSKHSLLFATVCWLLWRARNERLFSGSTDSASTVTHRISSWVRMVTEVSNRSNSALPTSATRELIDVAWDPGPEGWMNLGRCSITRAEIRGAVEGLRRAWDMGLRKVALQMDSQVAITLLTSTDNLHNQHGLEIEKFKELRSRDWDMTITHTYREGNHSADYLAGIGYGYPFGSHSFPLYDCNLVYFLRYDCSGIAEQRLIRIND